VFDAASAAASRTWSVYVTHEDLRDFEPEAVFDIPGVGDDRRPLTVAIARSGGGIIGLAYEGGWRAVVTYGHANWNSRELYRGGFAYTAPVTHQQAAAEFARLLVEEHPGLRLSSWGVDHQRKRPERPDIDPHGRGEG